MGFWFERSHVEYEKVVCHMFSNLKINIQLIYK